MSHTKKPRLGRGLASLMSTPVSVSPPQQQIDTAYATAIAEPPSDFQPESIHPQSSQPLDDLASGGGDGGGASGGGLTWLDISAIRPNPHQPRQTFDPQALQRLADSIRQDGLMQPIVVRPISLNRSPGISIPESSAIDSTTTAYELVAGERRWRAAKLANLDRIPAIIRELSDRQIAEWALIENLQREDLNPIERAEAFRGLIDRFHLRHEDVAQRVGIERATVSNSLRLLDLHSDIQDMIRAAILSAGHAKALLSLSDPATQLALAKKATVGGWSVRQLEQTVRRIVQPATSRQSQNFRGSPHMQDLEKQIADQLQTKVHLRQSAKKGAGSLTIEFFSLDQFDSLLTRLGIKVE